MAIHPEREGATIARVTVKEVAAAAGVSTATVSRVLSGRRPTGSQVSERVRASAEALGWSPDYVGRALRDQRTDTIGLVVPDIANPFFAALIQSLERRARDVGLGVLIGDAQNDPDEEQRVVDLVLGRRVDGMLISPCHATRSRAVIAALSGRVPLVQVDRVASRSAPWVAVDQDAPMREIADLLTGRRAAFVGTDESVSTARAREKAFVRHFGADAAGRVLRGDFSVGWGRAATDLVRQRWPDADAIVCAGDLIAFGVIQRLGELGAAVPSDVAVTGWDDTLLAVASRPAMTSVRQPVDALAEAALRLLAARGAAVTVPPVLVRRESAP